MLKKLLSVSLMAVFLCSLVLPAQQVKADNQSYYVGWGEIIGTGVRFRSSKKITTTNIIRNFEKGENVWISDSNAGYSDGYDWCYVEDSNGKKGYVVDKYVMTLDCGP